TTQGRWRARAVGPVSLTVQRNGHRTTLFALPQPRVGGSHDWPANTRWNVCLSSPPIPNRGGQRLISSTSDVPGWAFPRRFSTRSGIPGDSSGRALGPNDSDGLAKASGTIETREGTLTEVCRQP